MRSSPLLVILVILVFTAAGVAAGMIRKPRYSANAKLSVLHLNFGVPGALSGFSTAAAVLADTYARAIHADGLIYPLATKFHVSPATIREELSAAAVPQTPVFTVTAVAFSRPRAINLANAAVGQLILYVEEVNTYNPDAKRLHGELTRAETALAKQQASRSNLQAAAANAAIARHTPGVLSPSDQAALARAQAKVTATEDQVNSLRQAYQQSVVGQSATQFLQPLESAAGATSDRKSKLELLVFAGLAVGLGVGVAIALLRYASRQRRVRP